ncbi:MAG: hypothetical protein K0Q66_1299 [Chitinophagaceae bacterium]|jgi:hypothetical protein|nr:hypothetical protein [Chitinophagaceae bacterium]
MKKFSLGIIATLIAAVLLIPALTKARKVTASIGNVTLSSEPNKDTVSNNTYAALYDSLKLDQKGLSRQAFELALAGYNKLSASGKIKNNKLSIVDFSQASNKNRLYIIDVEKKKLLFNTLVAHGKNSGEAMAKKFSNTNESLQSSLGFYVTAEKYQGKHGLSLRLDGMEKSNSNARQRAVVMHGAGYVNESLAKSRGFIGRSWGCPAVNPELNEPIINAIGNGSCLFIYSPQEDYLAQSSFAKAVNTK